MSAEGESKQLSDSLTCWGDALKATHRIAEATRQIETTKESLQALNKLCTSMNEVNTVSYQQALQVLNDCENKINELCTIGVPLTEHHGVVESLIKKMIETSAISETDISEVKTKLDACIRISQEYLQQIETFLGDMEKLRQIFGVVIKEAETESANLDSRANSARRWSKLQIVALGGAAGILGISCTLVAAPLAAAIATCSIPAGIVASQSTSEKWLSASQLSEKAQRFREALGALKACDHAFEALGEKVRLGPVPINKELIDSLRHILQVYGMVHEKDDKIDKLTQENIQLTAQTELSVAKAAEYQAENEKLRRQLARLQSTQESSFDEAT